MAATASKSAAVDMSAEEMTAIDKRDHLVDSGADIGARLESIGAEYGALLGEAMDRDQAYELNPSTDALKARRSVNDRMDALREERASLEPRLATINSMLEDLAKLVKAEQAKAKRQRQHKAGQIADNKLREAARLIGEVVGELATSTGLVPGSYDVGAVVLGFIGEGKPGHSLYMAGLNSARPEGGWS